MPCSARCPSMREPKSSSGRGKHTHSMRTLGMSTGATAISIPHELHLSRNSWNLAFDTRSARMGPLLEHLVTFRMSTWQPSPAATTLMALTMVVLRLQKLLYPFRQMPTDPALSTQILSGLERHISANMTNPASGPISSKAESFLPTFLPSTFQEPPLTLMDQGM